MPFAVQELCTGREKLRGRLAKEVDMRYTPQVRFIADDSYDEARRIDELLASPRVRRDLSDKAED